MIISVRKALAAATAAPWRPPLTAPWRTVATAWPRRARLVAQEIPFCWFWLISHLLCYFCGSPGLAGRVLPFSGFSYSQTGSGFFAGLPEGAAGRCEDSCLRFLCTGLEGMTGVAGVTGRGGVSGRLSGVPPGPLGVAGAGAAAGGFDWTGLVPGVG